MVEANSRLKANEAEIKRTAAALEMARLNLSYTIITAANDGVLGRRSINEGQLLQAGQQVATIVTDDNKWVVANFREKQMPSINIGSKVAITVDALNERSYEGIVTAISEATGARYSAVPVDNSTGNFVKVQQRIPVRIEFTSNAKINLAMIPGIILGGILANQWFKRNWSMKSMLFIAFASFQISTILLYFIISPVIEIEYLLLTQVFRGLGMCLVFIGASFYFASKLSAFEMMSTISILIAVRSFIGTAFFGAVFSWAPYQLQWDSLSGLIVLIYILLHPFERMHHRKLIILSKRLGGRKQQGIKYQWENQWN